MSLLKANSFISYTSPFLKLQDVMTLKMEIQTVLVVPSKRDNI